MLEKPKKKKKHKTKTPKPIGDKICYARSCGSTVGLEIHHVFYGDSRDFSNDNKCVEWLCNGCHRGSKGIHGTHSNGKLNKYLKQKWQRILEGKGMTRLEFIYGAGKNYLD